MAEESVPSSNSKIKKLPKLARIIGVFLLIICIIIAGVLVYKHYHVNKITQAKQDNSLAKQALLNGNKTQALAYAKKALSDQPNNINNIQFVANIANSENSDSAKQYYAQALSKFKQQHLGSTANAGSYWFAASLAKEAGENDQAIKYYQEVIKTANPSNSYEENLAKQAPIEIKELQ